MDRRTALKARLQPLHVPLLLVVVALAGCDFAPATPKRADEQPSQLSVPLQAANAATADLYRVVETYFDHYLALNPIYATALGDHRFDDQFGDYVSVSWMADSLGIEQESLERLQAINPRQLTGEDRITYQAFKRQRELNISGYRYPSELLALDQVDNWPVAFAELGSGRGVHPFRTTRDYDNFLRRMDGFTAWVDQAINNLRAGVSKGVVLPKVVVERTLPQLEAFGRIEDPRQSVFWQPLLNFPAGPTVADRQRLLRVYDEKLRNQVLPAYRRLHDYLARDYLPQARDSVAWSSLPSGDLWYDYLVRYYTDSGMTPDDVHLLGLREVSRLRSNLAALQPVLGAAGDARALFDTLRADPRFQFGDAQSLLAAYAAIKSRVDTGLPVLFPRRPAPAIEIRSVAAFRAPYAPATSSLPADVNRTRPGVLYVNTHEVASRPSYDVAASYLREAAPGRLYQVARAQQAPDLPRIRRFGRHAAYDDGWALYSQSLGGELGLYADPYSQAGALAMELWRAALLVVDTGIHARGWSRQRAIDYLRANTALGEADLAAEVERCIARPGSALASKVGQLKLLELRRVAQQRLGARFDVREFHEQVVGGGSLPLPVLEAKLARWVAARR